MLKLKKLSEMTTPDTLAPHAFPSAIHSDTVSLDLKLVFSCVSDQAMAFCSSTLGT